MNSVGRLNCRNDNYMLTKQAEMKGHIHKYRSDSQESYRCCYSCGQSGLLKEDCKQPKSTEDHPKSPGARAMRVDEEPVPQTTANEDPYSFLESSSDEEAEDDAGMR